MKEQKVKRILAFIMIMLALILCGMGQYYYQIVYTGEVFLPRVEIASIAVEGLSCEQASTLLSDKINTAYNRKTNFQKEDHVYICQIGDLAENIDADEITQDIWKQEKQLGLKEKWDSIYKKKVRNYPVKIQYKQVEKAKLITDWNREWGSAVVEPRLEVDRKHGLVVIPGKPAIQVDEEGTFGLLPSDISIDYNINIPIKLKQVSSQVDEDSFRNMGELASFTSYYKASEINRSHNLSTAAAGINGKIVQPGNIFSFNGQVGTRTLETGYKEAMVIVGDGYAPGIGGGICQVSSTLYNACLLAGLQIVERHNHAMAVSYVPIGQDATVLFDVLDYKFKNSTRSPIYLRAEVGGGVLTIYVYGNMDYQQNVKIRNIVDQKIPNTSITKIDSTLIPGEEKLIRGGLSGYVVRSFRDFYDTTGKLISTEALGGSRYRPLNKIVLKGPEVAVEPSIPPQDSVLVEVDQDPPGGDEIPNQISEGQEEPIPVESNSQTGEVDSSETLVSTEVEPSDEPSSQEAD